MIEAYKKKFGHKHAMLKLAEECNELSQALIKAIDKELLGEPVTEELIQSICEEMAHVSIFWGMVYSSLPAKLITSHDWERRNRLSNKLKPTTDG